MSELVVQVVQSALDSSTFFMLPSFLNHTVDLE